MVDGTCIVFVAKLLVHKDHIEGALVVDDVVQLFFNKCKCILVLELDPGVGFTLSLINQGRATKTLSDTS